MFKRLWSGLPEDPSFPSDLEKLGYFVNDDDEIRNIEDPKSYFKFFITRNDRHNERQRYAMNEAVEKVVHQRLEALGLTKLLLPLGLTEPALPHIPIFISSDVREKSRIVIIFGESTQDLGILAHRVIGGPGGVNKGSMVSVVRDLQQQPSTVDDPSAPGIILANTGQLYWHPVIKRALTMTGVIGAPKRSAVHGEMFLERDSATIPGNRTKVDHVHYIFEKVVPAVTNSGAVLQAIGVGHGADAVEQYLDSGVDWARRGSPINAFAIVGGLHPAQTLQCESFRQFLREKARAWIPSQEPLDLILSGPDGNPNTAHYTDQGCAVLSAGEEHHTETALIKCRTSVLTWLEEVALTKGYINPILTSGYFDINEMYDDKWEVPEDEKWTPDESMEGQDQEDGVGLIEEGENHTKADTQEEAGSDRPITAKEQQKDGDDRTVDEVLLEEAGPLEDSEKLFV